MLIRYHLVKDTRNTRQRVRKINLEELGKSAADKAIAESRTVIMLRNGGTVANAYDYPAETQCGLAVAVQIGDMMHVILWGGSRGAKSANDCNTAGACCPEAYAMFDGRLNDVSRDEARTSFLRHAKLMARITPGYGYGEHLLAKEQAAAKRHATKALRDKLEAATIQAVREVIPV